MQRFSHKDGTEVTTKTMLQTGQFRIQIPVGPRDFSLLQIAQTAWGPPSLLWVTMFFTRDKVEGAFSTPLTSSSAKLRMKRATVPLPLHVFTAGIQKTLPLQAMNTAQHCDQRDSTCSPAPFIRLLWATQCPCEDYRYRSSENVLHPIHVTARVLKYFLHPFITSSTSITCLTPWISHKTFSSTTFHLTRKFSYLTKTAVCSPTILATTLPHSLLPLNHLSQCDQGPWVQTPDTLPTKIICHPTAK
jgi:hypothetical protein